jgi:hypothetical protein
MTTSSATSAFYTFSNGQKVDFNDYKTINKLVRSGLKMPKIQYLGNFHRKLNNVGGAINGYFYNIVEIKTDSTIIGERFDHKLGRVQICEKFENGYHSYWKD